MLVRIEDVRIDGVPCTWSLAPAPNQASRIGRRVFDSNAMLRCTPSRDLPATGATLECDVLLIRNIYQPAVFFDPIVDSTTPPDDWHMNQVVVRKTVTFPIQPPSPSTGAPP
jgi:hypothetical protein